MQLNGNFLEARRRLLTEVSRLSRAREERESRLVSHSCLCGALTVSEAPAGVPPPTGVPAAAPPLTPAGLAVDGGGGGGLRAADGGRHAAAAAAAAAAAEGGSGAWGGIGTA